MPRVWNKRDARTPEGAIYVGRPSRWGNPFSVQRYGRKGAIERYSVWLTERLAKRQLNLRELEGKDLVCWCAPRACHADILLRHANQE